MKPFLTVSHMPHLPTIDNNQTVAINKSPRDLIMKARNFLLLVKTIYTGGEEKGQEVHSATALQMLLTCGSGREHKP
jgi:hypothetical protein